MTRSKTNHTTSSFDDPDLPEFCDYPRRETDCTEWEKLTLTSGPELGRALRWLSNRVSSFSLDRADFMVQPQELDEALKFYGDPRFLKSPRRFFVRPQQMPNVCVAKPFPLSHGEVVDLLFRSNFTPVYPKFIPEYRTCRENLAVHARWWRHPGKPLGTAIAVHGWFMGDQRVNALALLPGFFYRLGLDVILYELPYHGRRAPGGAAQRGVSFFPGPHLARTNEAVAQAIYDLRSLASWVRAETDRPVGVVGMSLGAYVAALWASLDRLAFALTLFPLVSMGDLAWEVLTKHPKRDSDEWTAFRGISLEDLRRAYAVHCPLSYAPRVSPRRRMIVAGLGDAMIPPEQPGKLWEHWGRPRMYWFPGGHIGHFSQSDVMQQICDFLTALRLARKRPLEVNA